MVAKNLSKQEALRNRVYSFLRKIKNLEKIYTVNHFTAKQVPRRTVYSILSRLECLPALRKPGSGSKYRKLTQRQVNQLKKDFNHKTTMSQRQSARKFDISQPMAFKILKKNQISARKKIRIPSRPDQQKI